MNYPRTGERVRVLEIHPDDGSPYVEVGDEVELTANASPYDADTEPPWLNIHAGGGLTYARVELVSESIERVRGLLVSDDTVEPMPAPEPFERAYPIVEPAPPAVPVPPFMSTDSATRKLMPVATGTLAYFADALMLVAWISRVGNEKHNPGQPLHWAKEKSADEPDAEVRHMLDFFRKMPPDPGLEALAHLGHLASKAWRANADLQRACDAARAAFERGEDWRK